MIVGTTVELHMWATDVDGGPAFAEASQLLGIDESRRASGTWRTVTIAADGTFIVRDPLNAKRDPRHPEIVHAVRGALEHARRGTS